MGVISRVSVAAREDGLRFLFISSEDGTGFEHVEPAAASAVGRLMDSETLPNLPHPLDLLLDDFGLADVASRVEAPRDERESLLGDRLGLLQVPGGSHDCEGSRGGGVQMPALLVDAREEELRPRAADALFVDLELLPRLRT